MSKTARRVIWIAGFLIMLWVMYQLFGWLGPLLLLLTGAIGGVATVFINREIKRNK